MTEISDPSPRQASSAVDVVRVLRAAYPDAWGKHLCNLGVTAPVELPPAKLTRFMNRVFWLVRQSGIKDPAAWIAANPAPVEIAGDIPVHRDAVELEPVKLGVDLAKTSGASPPTPVTAVVELLCSLPTDKMHVTAKRRDPEPEPEAKPDPRRGVAEVAAHQKPLLEPVPSRLSDGTSRRAIGAAGEVEIAGRQYARPPPTRFDAVRLSPHTLALGRGRHRSTKDQDRQTGLV